MHLSMSLMGSGFVQVLVFVAWHSLLQVEGSDHGVQAPWIMQLGCRLGVLRSSDVQSAFLSESPSQAVPPLEGGGSLQIRIWTFSQVSLPSLLLVQVLHPFQSAHTPSTGAGSGVTWQ